MSLNKHLTGTNIALVSVFAGFIAASTLWGGVEVASGVPFTLQTLTVVLAGAVLGPWRGASAVLLYLLLGTVGAPIFAGHATGGTAWPSVTAGFLIGFVPAAFVTGWIMRSLRRRGAMTFAGAFGASVVGGVVVLYPIGWTYLALRAGLTFDATLIAAAPFAVFDVVKAGVAATVAMAVHRAYPGILGVSAPASSARLEETEARDAVPSA